MQKKMRTLENIRTLSSVVARRINRVKLQPILMTKRENSFLTGSSYLNNFLNIFGSHWKQFLYVEENKNRTYVLIREKKCILLFIVRFTRITVYVTHNAQRFHFDSTCFIYS